MQFLRKMLDDQHHHFEKGGKLERFYYLFEANDTILFTPGLVTKAASHVRDALDQKRMMITVVIALLPWSYGSAAAHGMSDSSADEAASSGSRPTNRPKRTPVARHGPMASPSPLVAVPRTRWIYVPLHHDSSMCP